MPHPPLCWHDTACIVGVREGPCNRGENHQQLSLLYTSEKKQTKYIKEIKLKLQKNLINQTNITQIALSICWKELKRETLYLEDRMHLDVPKS